MGGNETKVGPLPGWLLYITNHFTHPVIEAQAASPRYHLARKLAEKGQKMLVYCPLGTHEGNPLHDFLANLRPRKFSKGNTTYLFPPLFVSPSSIVTVPTLISATCFIMLYLSVTRLKVSAQYCTTTLVGSVSAVLRMSLGIPLVANYGDPDFVREHGMARRAFGFCETLVLGGKRAHSVVYVDEVVGKYVKERFHPRNVHFLPNGGYEAGYVPPAANSFEISVLRRKLKLGDARVVLYAGQVTSNYRLDLLVSAAPQVISKAPDTMFVIVGDGPGLKSLRQSVRDAGLDSHFVFVGSVPYRELSPYVSMADVCVQLLNDWCMGTKVILYMVHRRPVISSGAWFRQYSGFLRNGDNCILIPPSAEELELKLTELLLSPTVGSKLGEAGWKTVMPYTWDKHADETLVLLDEATQSY